MIRSTAGIDMPGARAVDWKTEWMRYLVPVRISPGFWLAPLESEVPGGARVIRYRPALAFGDGGHATTRLASRALEQACGGERFREMVDLGSGTGVLALVALLSGVERAVGIEVSREAIAASLENAALNGLATRFSVFEPGAFAPRPFPLVVANLEFPVLMENAVRIAALAEPGARVFVTGFLTDRSEQVRARFDELAFVERGAEHEDGWNLLEFSPRGAGPQP